MNELMDLILARYNYWVCIVLLMIGLYAMIAKKNLIKKLIGMSIFQTAIILFYVSMGVKSDATIPVLHHEVDEVQVEVAAETQESGPPLESVGIDPSHYANPLPHVLMLTTIVVGVSIFGLALAITQRIHGEYGTLEEDKIVAQIKSGRD